MTKQAVSQAIDILASRGYLERHPDPADRRRNTLGLTGRSREVVDAVVRGVEAVDAQLLERVPAEQVGAMRSALLALAEIKTSDAATGAGRRQPARQLEQFTPIFPVRDMAAALAHYATLGFDTFPYEGGNDCATRMPSTRSGPGRVSPAAPARSARPRTACAKAPTPTRTGT